MPQHLYTIGGTCQTLNWLGLWLIAEKKENVARLKWLWHLIDHWKARESSLAEWALAIECFLKSMIEAQCSRSNSNWFSFHGQGQVAQLKSDGNWCSLHGRERLLNSKGNDKWFSLDGLGRLLSSKGKRIDSVWMIRGRLLSSKGKGKWFILDGQGKVV